MTGEEWMINRPGAYLPDVYEEVRKWFTIQNIIDAFPPRTQCIDFDDFKYQKRKKKWFKTTMYKNSDHCLYWWKVLKFSHSTVELVV